MSNIHNFFVITRKQFHILSSMLFMVYSNKKRFQKKAKSQKQISIVFIEMCQFDPLDTYSGTILASYPRIQNASFKWSFSP